MSRAPAKFTQADVARIIRAAKQEGAPYLDVSLPRGVTVRIPLTAESTTPLPTLDEQPEVVL